MKYYPMLQLITSEYKRHTINDEYLEAHPCTALDVENIEPICIMVNADQYVTYCEIEATLGFTRSNIILCEHYFICDNVWPR